jgi:hypothetical protein
VLLGASAAGALLLAANGLYGMPAFGVARRTRRDTTSLQSGRPVDTDPHQWLTQVNLEAGIMNVPINAKRLRATLPDVVERVRKGTRFTVIYRSRPAFQLAPSSFQRRPVDA